MIIKGWGFSNLWKIHYFYFLPAELSNKTGNKNVNNLISFDKSSCWSLCPCLVMESLWAIQVFEKVFPVRCAMVMFQNISSSGFLSSCRYGLKPLVLLICDTRPSDISKLNWSLRSALLHSSTTTNNLFQKSSPWQWMFNSLAILIILGTVRMCVWRCSRKNHTVFPLKIHGKLKH